MSILAMLEDTQKNRAPEVVRELEHCECLTRLSEDPSETRSWQDYDLASFVENRLGLIVVPSRADEQQRQTWIERATLRGEEDLGDPHSGYAVPFWILDGARRVGTVAISTSTLGGFLLPISSLYVIPDERGRGHAYHALRAVYDACLRARLSGIRLSTEWTWQEAVRFYLRLGMWVRGWKRSLDFIWHRKLPRWRLELDDERARFVIDPGGGSQTLIEARRDGERLEWRELPALTASERYYEAPGTFAVALAVNGFPLITSDDAWQEQLEQGFSDLGGPEGLAFKIRRFEAWDRKHGWRVETPRIPGLDYPDWDTVE